MLPAFLWLRYFIDAQKLNVKEAVIYQDNHSDVLLDNNFRLSSGNRTKHILVRYFMIKDLIAMGDLKVKYFPTGKMIANYFTKPFQGDAFQKFRAEIQGILEDTLDTDLVW